MLTYTLREHNHVLTIDFRGGVDEKAPATLTPLLARLSAKVITLNMEAVEYFNSLGIKAWAHFVKPLVQGRKVTYENCPPDFINQVNMMPLLADSIPILSFSSEFVCPNCNHGQREQFDATEDKKVLLAQFEQKICSECQSQLLPDEDPETILSFKNS
ncbi:MAG: hypothetical protein H7249_18065 [Chitinophagaceae bacterium]|nr:hypothetical protein [Oligoflexus sp.]